MWWIDFLYMLKYWLKMALLTKNQVRIWLCLFLCRSNYLCLLICPSFHDFAFLILHVVTGIWYYLCSKEHKANNRNSLPLCFHFHCNSKCSVIFIPSLPFNVIWESLVSSSLFSLKKPNCLKEFIVYLASFEGFFFFCISVFLRAQNLLQICNKYSYNFT